MNILEARRILGIVESDGKAEVKRKFRKLIGRYHPDAIGNDTEACHRMTQRLNEAYSILKGQELLQNVATGSEKWCAPVFEDAFIERNIYAPYSVDIDSEDLYQTVTRGKYMWNPDEEIFALFIRSLLHATQELLDAMEQKSLGAKADGSTKTTVQMRLFHLLALQYIDPLDCLRKLADPIEEQEDGSKIYCFRAFLGEKRNLEIKRNMAALKVDEDIYPKAMQGTRLLVQNHNGGTLGHLSLEDDALYYCLYPLMKAKLLRVKMKIQKIDVNPGRALRQTKAEVKLLCQLLPEAEQYQRPDVNSEIHRLIREYEDSI